MPKTRTSRRFKKAYKKLPKDVQMRVRKATALLMENPRHPSLQAKPIQGIPGIYECRVDQNYRMTYERIPGDILLLRIVGLHDEALHDEALKNP